MKIEIRLKTGTPKAAQGVRNWLNFALQEFIPKFMEANPSAVLETNIENAQVAFRMGECLSGFSLSMDSTGKVVRIYILSVPKGNALTELAAENCLFPPIPFIVFLLASFRVANTRIAPSDPCPDNIPFSMYYAAGKNRVDNSTEETAHSFELLREIVPPAWYIPYSAVISTLHEAAAKRNKK